MAALENIVPQTILIVDDDPLLRDYAIAVLRQGGYTLLSAPGGQEALVLLGSAPSPIHLLLSDVEMPRMGGIELAGHVKADHPQTPVLLMTGMRNPPESQPLIRKPFGPGDLLRKVAQLLAPPLPLTLELPIRS